MNNKKTFISLFCGCGGMDMGFEMAGFKTIWANDSNKDACESHRLWSKTNVICEDISKIPICAIPDSDIIIGGFPCQGFSLAGPRKIDDSRNLLYKYFVNIVAAKKPKTFVAENVKGILTLGKGKIIEAITEDFKSKGYHISVSLVNSADYNVPQDRKRVFIIGIRNDIKAEFVLPKKHTAKPTLRDFLMQNTPVDMNDVCVDAYSSRYMSRNRKRDWDKQSFTIPAMAKQVPLHPDSPDMIYIDKDKWVFGEGKPTRRFSYKEAALIQTFPPDTVFCGNLTSKYKQIGNAVPVNLAYHVALQIKKII